MVVVRGQGVGAVRPQRWREGRRRGKSCPDHNWVAHPANGRLSPPDQSPLGPSLSSLPAALLFCPLSYPVFLLNLLVPVSLLFGQRDEWPQRTAAVRSGGGRGVWPRLVAPDRLNASGPSPKAAILTEF